MGKPGPLGPGAFTEKLAYLLVSTWLHIRAVRNLVA